MKQMEGIEMKDEQKELYFYTMGEFDSEINKLNKSMVAPIIVIRQTVKKAMEKYITEYCSKNTKIEDIFSEEDFKIVCDRIYNELSDCRSDNNMREPKESFIHVRIAEELKDKLKRICTLEHRSQAEQIAKWIADYRLEEVKNGHHPIGI